MKYIGYIILLLTLLTSCSSSNKIIISIQKEYDYLYDDKSNSKNYLNCINASRKSGLKKFFKKNNIEHQRTYIVELYNHQYKDMYLYVYNDKQNIEEYYYRKPLAPCNMVFEFSPSENFDTKFYRSIVQIAKNKKYHELYQGSIKYPISEAGIVFLTIIDFINLKKFIIIKTLVFEEFDEHEMEEDGNG